ncbi:MAG: cation:dicarboxylase symporter family transporter [Sphingomicrobium sp.]
MTEASKQSGGGVRPYFVLVALVLGLLAGAAAAELSDLVRTGLLQVADFVGGLWLNGLKMTVVPLVVALLIVGVAAGAQAARAGRIAGRAVLWIVIICTLSAIFGALMIELLTATFPLPRDTAMALQNALAGVDQKAAAGELPGIIDFFKTIVPSNIVAAAANGDVLPLVVFALLFALAVSRIAPERRKQIVGLFEGIADAMLVIIGWVLWLAPIGVFALAFTVGASAGTAAFAGLGHYILLISTIGLLVTVAAYPLAVLVGRVGAGTFTRAMIAPESVAISTRSSLACLPAMLTAARSMGIRDEAADVTLPLAVALFRATGPAMNTAVAFYVAHWLGLEPSVPQMIAATAVGAIMSYGAISLPGEVSFISSIAPIAMALGVPIAPLALLVAVEMVPDIFRTLGNVTNDVALAAVVSRGTAEAD